MAASQSSDALALLRDRNFGPYVISRFIVATCQRTLMVVIGYQIYDITNDPVSLGYVGLASFLPTLFLLLPSGDIADRYDRRLVMLGAHVLLIACTGLFVALSYAGVHDTWPYYAALGIFGASNSIYRPSSLSTLVTLIGRERLMMGFLVHASVVRIGVIFGPLAGGIAYVLGPEVVYGAIFAAYVCSFAAIFAIRTTQQPGAASRADDPSTALQRLGAGLAFACRSRLILGAISLELFVTLLGGATVLLPIYARDILMVGPQGLGALRAAPAVGALVMTILLARFQINHRAGLVMFGAVAADGLATMAFGASETFVLSLAALAVIGATEMISINFRQAVVQLATPDHMRGRVSSVQQFFIGGSTELGDFESGVTAGLMGTVPAVVVGGAAMWACAGLWMWMFPELRRIDRVSDVRAAA